MDKNQLMLRIKLVEQAQKNFKEELKQKFDCSWVEALRRVVTENGYWDKNAIFYRGTNITFREMFEMGKKYALSMKALGLEKGDKIPLCIGHCPEEIFAILGASMIGASITPVGEHFDPEYLAQRIEAAGTDVIFVSDDKYREIKDVLPESCKKRVMFSMMEYYADKNAYRSLEVPFFDGKDRVAEFKTEDERIVDEKDFLSMGEDYFRQYGFKEEKGSLDDVMSITFSSGTTNSHRPKPIKHAVSTYVGMATIRRKETPDLNKFSKTGEIRTLVHIPLYSNTSLLASISDSLFLGETLCLEHIYDEKFYATALQINKPNMAIATPSHWISAMKMMEEVPSFKNADLRFLMAPFTAGEPTSLGEEKFINKVFRGRHLSADFPIFKLICSLGMGAGDCENSGIWRMPHRASMQKIKSLRYFTKQVEKGYETFSVVNWAILNEDGKYCEPNERGLLVIDAPFSMIEYDGMPEETAKTKICDAYGRTWTSTKLWAYYDEMGEVQVKGRFSKEEEFPTYLIDDAICKDTKNIMSCKTVRLENGYYVAHIGLQPNLSSFRKGALLEGIESRLAKSIPNEILEKLLFNIRPYLFTYPLTGSGKRSGNLLEEEGIGTSIKLISNSAGVVKTIAGEDYINMNKDAKRFVIESKD